ncbi:embryogenesis-like protein [Mercurialis annua]|uniref:embryogenesis-like protein n=1 Tax=Mercurialis annua TaxID=3986 RepID=UPI00215F7572|nr:embryogenesis-like protein [Mercurialis annua]
MHKNSQISLLKLLLRYPFQRSTKPIFPFPLKSHTPSTPTPLLPNSLIPKNLHSVAYPLRQHLNSWPLALSSPRHLSTGSGNDSVPELDVNREVDMINLKFAEAREEIEMAMESKETVYFNEEAECAREAVKEVLHRFEGLLSKLPDSEKAALQRSMGLKIEQLKAELQQLDD